MGWSMFILALQYICRLQYCIGQVGRSYLFSEGFLTSVTRRGKVFRHCCIGVCSTSLRSFIYGAIYLQIQIYFPPDPAFLLYVASKLMQKIKYFMAKQQDMMF